MSTTFSIRPSIRNVFVLGCVLISAVAAMSQTRPAPTQPPTTPPKDTQTAHVLMTTSKGEIVIELDAAKAPISVANFLAYVDKGFYGGTIFHRVMSNFMIQGGGFTPDMQEKSTDKSIKNEWRNGLKNTRGTIAMARRSGDGDSATSQFFINVVDNAMLDRPQDDGAAYAVFGKVIAGMKAVDEIRSVKTGTRDPHANVPVETVTIKKVEKITADEAKAKVDAEKQKPTTPPATRPAG